MQVGAFDLFAIVVYVSFPFVSFANTFRFPGCLLPVAELLGTLSVASWQLAANVFTANGTAHEPKQEGEGQETQQVRQNLDAFLFFRL